MDQLTSYDLSWFSTSPMACTMFCPKHWEKHYIKEDCGEKAITIDSGLYITNPNNVLFCGKPWKYLKMTMHLQQIWCPQSEIMWWSCWWLKSCTTWDVWNPINNGINMNKLPINWCRISSSRISSINSPWSTLKRCHICEPRIVPSFSFHPSVARHQHS